MATGAAAAISGKNPGGIEESPHWLCNIPPSAAASTLHSVVSRNNAASPN